MGASLPDADRSPAERAGSSWSIQVGTALGIPIRIHFTFLLLLVWFGIVSARSGQSVVASILFLVLIFFFVVLHELGHAAMAKRFGVRTREIVLYPIGGVARLENIPGGMAELMIAIAGPAVNLVLAVAFFVYFVVVDISWSGRQIDLVGPAPLSWKLFGVNALLFVFNLIPAFPMDGGRVLRAALSLRLGEERATDIAAAIGQGIAFLFGAIGLFMGNFILPFIALFVYMGAGQEAAFQRRRAAVVGRTAREAMVTRFETLAPEDSLGKASEHLLATHQQDFPVLDAWQRVAGILPRSTLLHGLARQGHSAAVLDVMERRVPTVAPGDDLERVLRMLQTHPGMPVLVIEDGSLIGMITLENVAEFIEVVRSGRHVS